MKVFISGEKEYIAGFCRRFGEANQITTLGEKPDKNTWLEIIDKANIKEKDAFIACGNNSNENIILCLMAKQLGAQKVYCFINNEDSLDTLNGNTKSIFSFDQLIFTEKIVGEHFAKIIRKNLCKAGRRKVFLIGKSVIGNCLIDELKDDTDFDIVHCEYDKLEQPFQEANDDNYIFVLTKDDEQNLYLGLKFQAAKIKNVITLVNNPENEEFFEKSGLKSLINLKNDFCQDLIWSFFEQS